MTSPHPVLLAFCVGFLPFFCLTFRQILRLCHTVIIRELKGETLSSDKCCVSPEASFPRETQRRNTFLQTAKGGNLKGLPEGRLRKFTRGDGGNPFQRRGLHAAGRAPGGEAPRERRGGPGPRDGTCAGSSAPATESPIQRCSRSSCW